MPKLVPSDFHAGTPAPAGRTSTHTPLTRPLPPIGDGPQIVARGSANTSRVLRLAAVLQRVGISRSSVYARIEQGTFPKQIQLGPRAVGWLESDIDAWLDGCVLASRLVNGGVQ